MSTRTENRASKVWNSLALLITVVSMDSVSTSNYKEKPQCTFFSVELERSLV